MGKSIYGPIPDHWDCSSLASLCGVDGVQTGPFGSQLHRTDYVTDGLPIITVEHLGDNRLLHDDMPRVSSEDAARLRRYALRKGDIVFSRVGSVDRRALVRAPEDGWLFSGRCLRIRPDPTAIDSTFLSYFFGLPVFRSHIRAIAVGATMPSINTAILAGIQVIVPPLPEQRAIAEVLGALDDKIEANRRVRTDAAALAAALLDAKINAAVEAGTLAIKPLGSVAKINLRSIKPSKGSIQYLDISSVGDNEMASPQAISWSDAPSRARRVAMDGDTVWSTVRPNRRSHCLVVGPPSDLVVSTGFAVLTPVAIGPSLLYGLTERTEFVDYLVAAADGSAYPAVRADRFSEAPLPLPPEAARREYEDETMPLRRLADTARREADVLAQLRDALLPKLLSGELRVRDAESLVDEAL